MMKDWEAPNLAPESVLEYPARSVCKALSCVSLGFLSDSYQGSTN